MLSVSTRILTLLQQQEEGYNTLEGRVNVLLQRRRRREADPLFIAKTNWKKFGDADNYANKRIEKKEKEKYNLRRRSVML